MTDNPIPKRKMEIDRENEESVSSKRKRCQRHDSKKKKDKDKNCEPCLLLNDIPDTKKRTKSRKKDRDKKKESNNNRLTKEVGVVSQEEKCTEKLRRKKTTGTMMVRKDSTSCSGESIVIVHNDSSTKKKKKKKKKEKKTTKDKITKSNSNFSSSSKQCTRSARNNEDTFYISQNKQSPTSLPCKGTVEKVKKRKGGRASSDGIFYPRTTSSLATGSFDGPKLVDGGIVKSADGNTSLKSSKLAELLSENSMIDLTVQQVVEKTKDNESISSGRKYRREGSSSSSKSLEEKEGEEGSKRLSPLTVIKKSRPNGSTSSDFSLTISSRIGRSKKSLSSDRIKEQKLKPAKVESSYQCPGKNDSRSIIIEPCILSYERKSSSRRVSTTRGKFVKKDQRLKQGRHTLQNDSSSTNTSIASKVEGTTQNPGTENNSLMIRPPTKKIAKIIEEKRKYPRMSSDTVSLDRPVRTRRSLQRMRFPRWSKRWNLSPSLIRKTSKSLQKLPSLSSIASNTSRRSEDDILWYLQPTSKLKTEQDPMERCTMEMIFFDQ
ncbi:hypothetical protein FRACYDRAFT_237664 [Fragilariopsis cylindrus CCMP1102]|uniref:Uncharacterized protein n=1 Tax=Fragilariopsis cylindrus CCMP1102 TaxID=635003 RepID=A0A1E7FHK1_9STRA|nr:hypothetical protein FRACYDRAFT_237664 [Fragilariopsis cylindrus CCMP1102]|eukprot:OEU17253.1 hypothetical protein FRACYDRAFT_237664 [Fragilariopsis cylindrus CCMP1102]